MLFFAKKISRKISFSIEMTGDSFFLLGKPVYKRA